MYEIAAVVVDEVGGAAAHLHDEPFGDVHGIDDPLIDEERLLLHGEHLYLYTAGHRHFVEEALLVFGAAHRRRGVGEYLVHVVGVAQFPEHTQGLDGLRHTLRLDDAVPVHILSEANRLFEFVEHHEIAALKDVDKHQSCRV